MIWALAFGFAFVLGAIWGAWFERSGSAGFVGALLGWAAGGAVGILVSSYVSTPRQHHVKSLIIALVWGLSFFVGGYVAIVAGMLLAEVAKSLLALFGEYAALTIGWGLGATLGGALASALGLAAHDAIIGSSSGATV